MKTRNYYLSRILIGVSLIVTSTFALQAQSQQPATQKKAETNKADASQLLDKALIRAGKENKNILVHLGAPW